MSEPPQLEDDTFILLNLSNYLEGAKSFVEDGEIDSTKIDELHRLLSEGMKLRALLSAPNQLSMFTKRTLFEDLQKLFLQLQKKSHWIILVRIVFGMNHELTFSLSKLIQEMQQLKEGISLVSKYKDELLREKSLLVRRFQLAFIDLLTFRYSATL
jgi:hypothetical protein